MGKLKHLLNKGQTFLIGFSIKRVQLLRQHRCTVLSDRFPGLKPSLLLRKQLINNKFDAALTNLNKILKGINKRRPGL